MVDAAVLFFGFFGASLLTVWFGGIEHFLKFLDENTSIFTAHAYRGMKIYRRGIVIFSKADANIVTSPHHKAVGKNRRDGFVINIKQMLLHGVD